MIYLVDDFSCCLTERFIKSEISFFRLLERDVAQTFVHAELRDLSVCGLGHFLQVILWKRKRVGIIQNRAWDYSILAGPPGAARDYFTISL